MSINSQSRCQGTLCMPGTYMDLVLCNFSMDVLQKQLRYQPTGVIWPSTQKRACQSHVSWKPSWVTSLEMTGPTSSNSWISRFSWDAEETDSRVINALQIWRQKVVCTAATGATGCSRAAFRFFALHWHWLVIYVVLSFLFGEMFHLVIVIIVSLSMFVRCEPSPFSNRDCRIQQERENIEVPTKGREQKGMEQVVVEMVVSHPRNPSMQFDFRVCEECKKSYKQSTGCTYILLYLQYLQ